MIRKIGKIVIVMMIILLNSCLLINSVQAANIQSADLFSLGSCGDLLKYKGSIIRVTYVAYKNGGENNPAYCLDASKPGVGESGNYAVSTNELIKDVGLWKRIINGYPYKTTTQLRVINKEEAFTATKQAIYCYIHGNNPADYEGIGEAGKRTLDAMLKIIEDANSSSENMISNQVEIVKDSKQWEPEESQGYVSKTYHVKATGEISQYEIMLSGKLPEGTLMTNMNNEKQEEFKANEKFKIQIPIRNLTGEGEFEIKVATEVKTKPVLYGKAPNSSMQDYAITGFMYEDSIKQTKENFTPNETKIKIIKKDSQTNATLPGTEFCLLDGNQKELYAKLITDEKGEILIKNLLPGTYYLKETKALDGYEPYSELVEIKVEYGEEVTIEVDNIKQKKPEIKTQKKESKLKVLPVAGR